MRNVKYAGIQMQCSRSGEENIAKADKMVREAAANGAQIILLPELFERQYFCQERNYDYYAFATPVDENPAVKHFQKVAAELKVVLPISFYERDINVFYNTVAVIDADGSVLGIYRKTHIPDDHYYQEKFYFTPGDTGFKVWDTKYARIGVGICWDQWFPETARGMAVQGAEILFYPTAIGSEPILEVDSMPHWRRCMQGHSAGDLQAGANYIMEHGGSCRPFIAPVDVQLDCDERTMVQPDVGIVCDTSKIKRFGIYGAPDFVVEVVSSSTKKKDYALKLSKYMEAGVREYWILDFVQEKVLVYFFESDVYPVIYGFDKPVPVNIYNGELKIDFTNIARWLKEGME